MKIAAAQYPVSHQVSWDAYADKLEGWVFDAARAGAQLLLFPEYAPMELTSLFEREVQQDARKQLPALQPLLAPYLELHAQLARAHGVYLVAGSFPVLEEVGAKHASPLPRYLNRAYFFAPDGSSGYQDKLVMTRFEREEWGVSSGAGLRLFETALGRVCINICYDSEFPPIAHRQVLEGANVVLVPSCTDTLHGYHRVQVGSRARALENQCYTVTAPLLGTSDGSEVIDVCVGAAAVYTPISSGFPEDGVLTKGELNAPGWVYADLDLGALEETRLNGQTFNFRQWDEGEAGAAGPLERVRL